MFQDVVAAEVIKGKCSRVLRRIGRNSKVKEKRPKIFADVQGCIEGTNRSVLRDVFAIMRQIAVIGQCVEHGARGPHCRASARQLLLFKILATLPSLGPGAFQLEMGQSSLAIDRPIVRVVNSRISFIVY